MRDKKLGSHTFVWKIHHSMSKQLTSDIEIRLIHRFSKQFSSTLLLAFEYQYSDVLFVWQGDHEESNHL